MGTHFNRCQISNTLYMYIGSWISTTDKDVKVRRACAWNAVRKLDVIWKSNLPGELKVHGPSPTKP